jgi:hypothetical protein
MAALPSGISTLAQFRAAAGLHPTVDLPPQHPFLRRANAELARKNGAVVPPGLTFNGFGWFSADDADPTAVRSVTLWDEPEGTEAAAAGPFVPAPGELPDFTADMPASVGVPDLLALPALAPFATAPGEPPLPGTAVGEGLPPTSSFLQRAVSPGVLLALAALGVLLFAPQLLGGNSGGGGAPSMPALPIFDSYEPQYRARTRRAPSRRRRRRGGARRRRR